MSFIKKSLVFISSIAIILTLGACNKAPVNSNQNDDINIVASFYPMYIFTSNLIKDVDGVSLSCMAKQHTGCLHNYQLSTEDMKALSDADLFITNGSGMEPFLDDVAAQFSSLKIINTSDNTNIINEGDIEHDHAAANAHVWLSPENAKIQVHNIAGALKDLIPNQADIITNNELQYISAIDNLISKKTELKQKTDGLHVISLHEAFSYLACDLGIVIDATIATDGDAEPGTQEITGIINLVKKNNISIILVPPEYSGNIAKILTSETGAKEIIIDPLTNGEFTLSSYEDVMTSNLDVLSKAVN